MSFNPMLSHFISVTYLLLGVGIPMMLPESGKANSKYMAHIEGRAHGHHGEEEHHGHH